MSTVYAGTAIIRRVQELMLVCALLPPESKLADGLRRALAIAPEPIKERIQPIDNLNPNAVMMWFEESFSPDLVSLHERELIEWQNDSDKMGSSIAELEDVEKTIGIQLVGALKS
jgi:hypothetical protein